MSQVVMGRDDIIELVQHTVADVAGVYETDVTLDSLLLEDLGLEADEFEDVAAHLQSVLDVHIAPEELFPDEESNHQTVQSLVNAIEEKMAET